MNAASSGPERRAPVPADLEQGLRETETPA